MNTYRLAVLDDYQQVAASFGNWDALTSAGVSITTFDRPFSTEAETVAALGEFDIVIAMRERTPFPRSVIAQLPKLSLLVTTGAANAVIDLEAASDHGVTVCGTTGSATAAPEMTWALVLALARNLTAEENRLRAGEWQATVGFELSGRTLGIVGLGKIGQRIARYGQAFGMEVLAWSQNLSDDTAAATGVRKVSKEELFRASDVVSLHLRLSKRSKHIVGEKELKLLGPDGVLINTARGPLVDQEALIRALHEGWIRGAALDVYDQEPLPGNHPILTAPRTVLAPHLGFVTTESYARFYGGAVEDVQAWLAGAPVRVLTS